jgi:diguanylate cyclase (GGDEF)-like protein/PAS domain S-box-containing protein
VIKFRFISNVTKDEQALLAQFKIFEKLQESEEQYRDLIDNLSDAVFKIDNDGQIALLSKAWREIVDVSITLSLNRPLSEFIHLDDRDTYGAFFLSLKSGEIKKQCGIFRLNTISGTTRWVEITASPLVGDQKLISGIIRDISGRKQTDEEIHQLNTELKQFKNTLDQTLDSVLMFDSESLRFTYVNQGAMLQLGYSETELLQMTAVDIRPLFTLEQLRQMLQPLVDGVLPSLTIESVHRHKDGHNVPVEIFLQLVRLEGQPPCFVAMVSDISERKQAEEQISFLAFHDVLTRLPNRLLAKDHLQQAIFAAERENAKVALLFIDLDNFKTINDSLGHIIGDDLLQGVAARLRECLRDTDTLSRQGGDEFLIVLNNMRDTDSITLVAEKIIERIAEPFEIDQHELSISLSIGITVYPDDGKDFDTLLKQSDTAMYQAKDSGRNTYRFHTEQMNIDAVEHLRMRNGLRRALKRDEFVLHYQPQISLASGAVIGAEALLRWNHPELGMVAPGRFISVAEDTGLIVPMGDWVLREACRQSMAWRKAELPELVMAVNLSAVQFKRGDVLKSVTQALTESGLEPALLELELTESILIKDAEKVLATVRQLKSLGVKLSIDDFGTGYSSLSYLKKFDVDKLKIDQSFVRDMVDDPNDAAIVRAIIQMAKGLNLTTIAEGVEDERQLALLRLQHCDEVQGYHFARPMPADQFESFMSRFMASAAKSSNRG